MNKERYDEIKEEAKKDVITISRYDVINMAAELSHRVGVATKSKDVHTLLLMFSTDLIRMMFNVDSEKR